MLTQFRLSDIQRSLLVPSDCVITLHISGNRLVSVLNALDAMAHETRRYTFEGNDIVASSPRYEELRNTTEAIRDELSRQRCAKRS
jgi:hypothetical protein